MICRHRISGAIVVGIGLAMVGGLAGPGTAGAQILERQGTVRLANKNLTVTLDKKSGEIAGITSSSPEVILPALSGRLLVADAGSKSPVALSPVSGWRISGRNLSCSVAGTAGSVGLRQRISSLPDFLEWEAELENRTDSRMELTVTLSLSFPTPAGWTYWDGANAHGNPSGSLDRVEDIDHTEAMTFPMACIYTKQGGLSVGIEPHQLFNFASGVGKEADARRSFHYTIGPVVLLPRQKVPATFVLYGFNPDYGFRSAMQSYYDAYPAVFWPRPDIDPRLRNAGGMALFLYAFEKFGDEDAKGLLREASRRFYATWDWGFPGQSTYTRWGEYYGHAEKWPEWYPERVAQRKRKAEIFTTMGRDEMAMGHYVCLNMVEGGLMEQFYPDGIIRDKNGQPVVGFTNKPAFTGREERIYNVNFFVDGQPNRLTLDTMADMKLLAKELNLPGFSFDICYGFPEARFADYVHTLTNNRYHLGVIENNPGDHTVAFRADVLLLECTPYGYEDILQQKRNLAGHKMAVYLWPYRITEVVDDLAAMSPAEIKETYLRLRDYTILNCLRQGNFPAPGNADGLPTMLRYFPILLEVCHAGWEPVVAMKLQSEDESLWLSRYGRGTGSFLVVGNSTRDDKTVSVRIDNRRLGDGVYLVSTYQGTPVSQVIKGRDTSLALNIPGGTPAILKSWLGIRPQGEVTASVTVTEAINRSVLVADVECSQAFATPVSVRVPEDFVISTVRLNGKPQSCRMEQGAGLFRGKLAQGKNSIEVEYASRTFTDNETDLLAFPFVKDGVPVCTLALTNPQSEDQKYVASLFQSYFRFYCEKKENRKVLLPVSGIADAGKEAKLVIEIKNGVTSGIKRVGNTIYLRAQTGDQAKDIARKFMRVLDRKYTWCPALGDTYSFEPASWSEVMKKKGLMGTILE